MSGLLPQVSVILPVYNGSRTVAEAIASILCQETVQLELVIVDDASTDDSREVVREFDDPRIVRIDLMSNHGVAGALNEGIAVSRGPLIARQDADDISHPMRLMRQVERFARQSDLILLGTWANISATDQYGRWEKVGEHRHPVHNDELRVRLLWNNPFVHSSVTFRRAAYDAVGGYRLDPEDNYPEDYDLWSRMMQEGHLGNIPEFLVTYRATLDGMSRTSMERLHAGVIRIGTRNTADAALVPVGDAYAALAVSALNNASVARRSLGETLGSAGVFWRASRSARRDGRPLLSMRLKAFVKIWVRSLTSP